MIHAIKEKIRRKIKSYYLGIRGIALFFFQLPLWIAIFVALFTTKTPKIAILIVPALCFFYATRLTMGYFRRCKRNYLETGKASSKRDTRKQAMFWIFLGVLVLASYVTRHPLSGVIIATLAGLGYAFSYLFDKKEEYKLYDEKEKKKEDKKITQPRTSIQDTLNSNLTPTLKKMIIEADNHLTQLQRIAQQLSKEPAEMSLARQIYTISAQASRLIKLIAESPDSVRAARSFLVIYIPELRRIAQEYVSHLNTPSHHQAREQFVQLLSDTQQAFTRENKLHSTRSLQKFNTQIDVLRHQLQQESPQAPVYQQKTTQDN